MRKNLISKILSGLLLVSFATVNVGLDPKVVQAAVIQGESTDLTSEVDGIIWSYQVDDNGNAIRVELEDTTLMGENGTIESITIPDFLEGKKVISIDICAFLNCTNLISITIPKGIKNIGDVSFSKCINLKEILVSEDNIEYVSINGVLYNEEKTQLLHCPPGKKEAVYTVLDSVTSIGGSAFEGCTSLTRINIPESVTNIGYEAFKLCKNLKEIIIPEGVTNIADSLFYECTSLTTLEIPKGVTSIGYSAFESCTNLKSINIPKEVTSIRYDTFLYCESLKEIVVSEENNDYTSVDGVLYNKNKTALVCYPGGKEGEYTVLDNATAIYDHAFESCFKLTSINIPDSVTYLGGGAFYGCHNLEKVEMPEGITEISYFLFYHCTNLKSINIPRGVTKIGYCSFGDCTSLKSISIPDALESIIWSSFIYCTNLTTVYANSDSYASSYPWQYGTVDTKTGYTEGTLIIKTKVNAEAKIVEANKALSSFTTKGGLETDVAYQDVKTTLSKYSTSDLIETEKDMERLENWISELDEKIKTLNNKEIKPLELVISSFESNVASPQKIGTSIVLSSTTSGGTGTIQSKFLAYKNGELTLLKDYSSVTTTTWIPKEAGTYTLYLYSMDSNGKAIKESMTYVVTGPMKITSFTSKLVSPQKVGTSIELSSTTSGGTGTIQSKFISYKNGKWTFLKAYSSVATTTWIPKEAGTYILYACSKDSTGKAIIKSMTYVIK